jgi:hypothetical protein
MGLRLQLSAFNFQLSAISYQLSVVSCQLSVVSCQVSVVRSVGFACCGWHPASQKLDLHPTELGRRAGFSPAIAAAVLQFQSGAVQFSQIGSEKEIPAFKSDRKKRLGQG